MPWRKGADGKWGNVPDNAPVVAPVEVTPPEIAPAEIVPPEDALIEDSSVEIVPVEDASVEDASVENASVEDASVEDAPAPLKATTLPQPTDHFDDISFDGTYMTSVTTEEVYDARNGTVEQKRVSGSGEEYNQQYCHHGAGNPSAYDEQEEDSRSMSSMSMLFHNARGGRCKEPQQSSDYANYQFDDDATVDSLSDIFGKIKSKTKSMLGSRSGWGSDDDDTLAGIIGDVANLHDAGNNDQIDNIEPEPHVPHNTAKNLADISDLHDPEEQSADISYLRVPEEQPKHDVEKADDIALEANTTTDLTSNGSKADNVTSECSFSNSSSSKNRRKNDKPGKTNKIMCLVIFAFVILAVVAAVIFFQIYYKKQRNNSNGNFVDDSPKNESPRLRIPTQSPRPVPDPTRSPLPLGHTLEPTTTYSPTEFPTRPPTQRLTSEPTVNYINPIMEFLQDNQVYFERDPLSPDFMAVQWLAEEAQINIGNDGISSSYGNGLELTKKLVQRFALLTLDFALMRTDAPYATKLVRNKLANAALYADYTQFEIETFARSNTIAVKYQDECQWVGVICASVGPQAGFVTEINFSHSGLKGTIPPEIKLFKNLKKLHLAGNELEGSIPKSLFNIKGLEEIYLYQNRLTGTISNNIGNMWNMTRLHLSHNELSGSIPLTFKSGADEIRPIEYLNLHSNKFTGTIPHDLRWREIRFADFGRNEFSGTLPHDIGERWVQLRFLYLDNNKFTGTIPDSYPTTGNGRIEAMTFNQNSLTGYVPGQFSYNKLLEFNVQDNMFTGIEWKACRQSVFQGGEMVEYKADCDICYCDPFCELKCEA